MAKYYESVNNKIVQLLGGHTLNEVLFEVGGGLLAVWVLGMLLELWRSGLVSLYFDLNLILVLGVLGILVGKKRELKFTWDSYLIIGLSFLLIFLIYIKF